MVRSEQKVIHADRGTSMKSKLVAQLLADLGVTKSHSRPHVSNDNPYSESQFRTMKYRPSFPDHFAGIDDARDFSVGFFSWHNLEHRHSGIGFHTPASIYYDTAPEIRAQRANVLDRAFAAHPERFVRGMPKHSPLPEQVWINPPAKSTTGGTAQ